MPRIVEQVVYQHAENACALWWQWQLALHEPHYDFTDLCRLENRIHANLDGLLIAGNAALPFIRELQDAGDHGATFISATLALRTGDRNAFMKLTGTNPTQALEIDELSTALIWASEPHRQDIVTELLDSSEPALHLTGLMASQTDQPQLRKYLEKDLSHDNPQVRIVALRTTAELADTSLLAYLPPSGNMAPLELYELSCALLRLGQQARGLELLESLALSDTAPAAKATRLLLLSADPDRSRDVLRQLDTLQNRQRDIVRGVGLLGDPCAMDWLIEQCNLVPLARLAGESISLITGVQLADNDLDLDRVPERAEPNPNDDPNDDNVDLDEDENLEWPDAARLANWWSASDRKPTAGTAHIGGHPRSPDSLKQVLRHGLQRQRTVAADLMRLSQPTEPYCNTHLPTHRQMQFMSDNAI